MGSCGLHVVHGAFQTGHKTSTWNINSVLRALYTLLKDSPARRADYIRITASSTFPKKLCQVRWAENAEARDRALEVFDNVKKYIAEAGKQLSKTATSATVIAACEEKSTKAKLAFFSSVAHDIEPFLCKFQTAAPMAPFLYDDLS